jgi:hypothetical protein
MDDAEDMLALRKAESKVKSAQWDLEKVCRQIYGEHREQQVSTPVQINIHLRRNSAEPALVQGVVVEPLPSSKEAPPPTNAQIIELPPDEIPYRSVGVV